MIEVLINGEACPTSLPDSTPFLKVVEHVKGQLDSRNLMIAAIRVKDLVLTPEHEAEIANRPAHEFGPIAFEISTYAETVEATVVTVMEFLRQMIALCRRIHIETDSLAREEALLRLADWVETFLTAVRQIRVTCRIGLMPAADVLTADLVELLKDVVDARERGDLSEAIRIVGEEVSGNLDEWYRVGIPALVEKKLGPAAPAAARQPRHEQRQPE